MAKGGGDNSSFAGAINRAAERPDPLGEGATQGVPNLFAFPVPPNEEIIENLKQPEKDTGLITGIPRYRLKAHFRRFIMGTITVPSGGGEFETTVYDDAEEYEALLNEMLQGRAVPRWEDRTTLKDGTVILAVSYLSVAPKKKQGDEDKEKDT